MYNLNSEGGFFGGVLKFISDLGVILHPENFTP